MTIGGIDQLTLAGTDGAYDIDLRDDTIAQIERIRLYDPSATGGTAMLRINASQLTGLDVVDSTSANVSAIVDVSLGTQHLFSVSAGQLLDFGKAGDLVIVEGTAGNDTILGSSYNERLLGAAGNDSIVGGGGNDTLDGGTNDDSLYAAGGNDSLLGGSGNDTLTGGGGKDTIDGGSGSHDRADYAYATTKVTAVLSGGKATVKLSASDTDTLKGIEDLAGGTKGDVLKGDTHANALIGNGGHDSLTGGAGNDHFVFNSLAAVDSDTVTDFSHGHDKLDLVKAVFTALGAGPALTAAEFYAHAGASHGHDSSDRIIYDTATGKLFYDDDGSGGDAAVQIGTISGHPALSASDFAII